MDTLSQLLQATRARSPVIADLRLSADISVGLPALGGVPFHYVSQGVCDLDTGSERVSLRAGDFVMLARVPHYRLSCGSGSDRVEAMDYAQQDQFSLAELHTGRDRLLRRTFGAGPVQARVLSAILMLGDRHTSPLVRDLPPLTVLRDSRTMLEPWVVAAIDFMAADGDRPEPGVSAVSERLIETVFIAVLRKWVVEGAHERGWMRGLTDPTISRVLNAMHAEPGRRWTLRALGDAAGCSRSALAQQFRNVMGETPFAYLTRWRMKLAATALAASNESVAALAAELGYSGAAALARTFQATLGETPAQYRRRHFTDFTDPDRTV